MGSPKNKAKLIAENEAMRHRLEALEDREGKGRRRGNYLLRIFIDALPNFGFSFDANHRILQVLTGSRISEARVLEGRLLADILPRKDAEDLGGYLQRTFSTGEGQSFEFIMSILAGRRWFQVRTSLVEYKTRDENIVVCLFQDITNEKLAEAVLISTQLELETQKTETASAEHQFTTERKRTEKALRESEEHFRALIENALDIITVLEADGTIRYESPSIKRLLGYEPNELVGGNVFEHIHPEDAPRVAESLARNAQIPGQMDSVVYRFRHKDGSWRSLESIGRNLLDDPAVAGIVVNSRDITESKMLEEQLRQSQKMEAIGTLAGGIAHDFNNLLQPIIGFSELAKEKLMPDSEEHQYLISVVNSALRAKKLVSQILLFSRRGQSSKKISDVRPIILEMIRFARSTLPKTIAVKEEISATAAPVLCDPTQLHQVFLNLCVNAGQAMPDVGELRVTLEKVELDGLECFAGRTLYGKHIRLAVTDTGIGMDKETLAQIFNPFFTTKEVGAGTGLGLSIVFGIVQDHEGGICVTSQPGEGSTIEIFLPEAEKQIKEPLASDNSDLKGGETILFIDDEEMITSLVMTVLEGYGYSVTALTDSLEALEIFKVNPHQFDLVVTDQSMPNMKGEWLAIEMRKTRADIPIILCTGHSETMTPESSKSIGINCFLYKPIEPIELGRVVRRVLDETKRSSPTRSKVSE